MARATLRFYGELNDFLPAASRQATLAVVCQRRTSVEDMIEARGLPHPEIAFLASNGHATGFGRIVQDGDRITVYPPFSRLDWPREATLGEPLPEPIRLVLDANLGALARCLKLRGFEARYHNAMRDDELASIAVETSRVVLTRDRDALQRCLISYGYGVRSDAPETQLAEVFRHFDLFEQAQPSTRCARCNDELVPVDKAAIIDRLEPRTRGHFETFRQCNSRGRSYWRGSHVAGIER